MKLPDRPSLPPTWAAYLKAMARWRKACDAWANRPYDWQGDR